MFSMAALVNTVSVETKNGFDLVNSLVPEEEMFRGGPPRDGIPVIDEPVFMPATTTAHMRVMKAQSNCGSPWGKRALLNR